MVTQRIDKVENLEEVTDYQDDMGQQPDNQPDNGQSDNISDSDTTPSNDTKPADTPTQENTDTQASSGDKPKVEEGFFKKDQVQGKTESNDQQAQEEARQQLQLQLNRTLAEKSGGRYKSVDELNQVLEDYQTIQKELEEIKSKPRIGAPKFEDETKQKLFAILSKSDNPLKDIQDYARYSSKDINSMSQKELLMESFLSDPDNKYLSEDERIAEFEDYYEELTSELEENPKAQRRLNAKIARAKEQLSQRRESLDSLVTQFSQSEEPEANATPENQENDQLLSKYQQETDLMFEDFGGISLRAGDEPDDIVQIQADAEIDLNTVKDMTRDPIRGYSRYFFNRYKNEDGSIKKDLFAQDNFKLVNFDKIMRETLKTGIAMGRERMIKERNNTDGTGAQAIRSASSAGGPVDERSEFLNAARQSVVVSDDEF